MTRISTKDQTALTAATERFSGNIGKEADRVISVLRAALAKVSP